MRVWSAPDAAWLLEISDEFGCAFSSWEGAFVLLDASFEIERIWQPRSYPADDEEGGEVFHSFEVEDDQLLGLMQRSWSSGRSNYDREIEVEDLVDPEEPPSEAQILRALRRLPQI